MPSPQDKFAAEFFEFDFFQAVRLLERIHPDKSPVGLDFHPAEEVARFRGHLSLAFPPSQILDLDPPDDRRPNPRLTVAFFGLYGPSGVLPQHYTQQLLELARDERGPERHALRDWFDLFNHRLISLFYRAWEKYRFHVAYDRGDAFHVTPDTFTFAVRSLMGLGTRGLRGRLGVWPAADGKDNGEGYRFAFAEDRDAVLGTQHTALAKIDDLAMLYYAGLFVQRPRNAVNLRALVADYFRLPAAVEPFRGQWLSIPEDGQARLGAFGTLGVDAVAGERVWDVQSRLRVRLGPLTYRQFEDLIPDPAPIRERKTFFLVAQLARLYAGDELDLDVQLVLTAAEVPEARLADGPGAGPRLGWTVWLISAPPPADAADAVFDAEWMTTL